MSELEDFKAIMDTVVDHQRRQIERSKVMINLLTLYSTLVTILALALISGMSK